jgi:hypothetical protein
MAKASKKKYNPKVTFNGSFEDLLGMTFSDPKFKFKVGDIVIREGERYIIIGSREVGIVPHGSDYTIQPENDKSITFFVKEVELDPVDKSI